MNRLRGRSLALLLAVLVAAGCGRDEPAAEPKSDVVTGSVAKGPLRGARVDFFLLDPAGVETGSPLVTPVTTDASGGFTVSGLPAGVPVLAKTSGGEYVDESDREPDPALKRRIVFASTDSLQAVLPPGATTVAITPYSMALYKKAQAQAAGSNFANVYAAVRAQAQSAFGFDPITTLPADPVTGAGGSRPYALLLGAAALRINQIAVTSTPEHLPGYADVIAFVDDFADGRLDGARLADLVRRFRNNNITVYSGTAAPSVNEDALSQPAPVPNVAPTISAIADQTIAEETSTGAVAFTVADAEDAAGLLTLSAASSNTTLVPLASIVFGGSGGSRTVTVTPVANGFGSATITVTVADTDGSTASEPFLLTVTNVNDAPVITSNGGGASAALSVAENATTVTTVTAGDPDGDTPTFAIVGGADAAAFGVNGSSGVLAFLSPPDFEAPGDANLDGVYEVTVQASDGALSDNQALSVTVTNVDEPPSLDVNAGLSLVQGDTTVITRSSLTASDVDSTDAAVVYDVTTPPASGVVEVSGVPASSFTQADLAVGLVAYHHDGSATNTDSFAFTLRDATGFSPDCPSVAPCTFNLTIGATPEAVLPYLTASGELRLFDPADPANPVLLENGVPLVGFEARMLLKASVSGGVASGIQPARLVYILNGTVRKVNLEPGQARTVAQVSNITDACGFNGVGDDFANPDNSIVRVDTAGTDGICGTADDFTSAPAWLVPLTTAGTAPGVQVGVGHCCGISGIGDSSGVLTGVLVAEDDGAGTTFSLNRRNVGLLGSPIPIATLDIGGTGEVYSHVTRGLGDQNIYLRASPSGGADNNYRLLRFNLDNTLTELFDYGVSDGSVFANPLDESPYDAASFYFVDAAATTLLKVDHAASGPGQATALTSVNSPDQITQLDQTTARIVFRATGPNGGVYSVPKGGGGTTTLAADDAAALTFVSLAGTGDSRVFVNLISGSAPAFAARAVGDDGATPSDINDAVWAGETFQRTCDFSGSCEHTIAAQARFLRRSASTNDAVIEVVDPVTGAPTGNLLPTVSGVETGVAAFASGFGRYAQFTFFSTLGNLDIWLGDPLDASPTPPGTAWDLVSADPGGDDQWLTFGSEDNQGGGTQDSDFDGLTDAQEAALGTDPFKPDTDGDGLTDLDEVDNDGDPNTYTAGVDTDPTNPDTDGDGLLDGQEPQFGTSALAGDTDGDGVGDGVEVSAGSDPVGTANPVIYANSACTASCDGTSLPQGFLTQGEVQTALGSGGASPQAAVFVLYAAGSYGALTVGGVSNAAFIGSMTDGVFLPAFPPTTIFTGTSPIIQVSNGQALSFSNIDVSFGSGAVTGGGVLVDGSATPVSVQLNRMDIHDNTAQDGGGVAVLGLAQLAVKDTQFRANIASAPSIGGRGGAIYVGGGTLNVEGGKFLSNQANNFASPLATNGGGAIYAEGSNASALIRNSSFADNSAFAGPGGAINLIDIATMSVEDSQFLSNQSTRPGGGLHIHQNALPSNPTHVLNNLFVGNVTTDPVTEGGAIEIEHSLGVLRINGNTVAYNQMVNDATTGVGGGVSVSPVNGTEFGNNIVWFNDNATAGGALEPGDNFFAGGTFAAAPTGNNVNDSQAQGNGAGLPSDPLFAQGFYLAQTGNPSVDGGDDSAVGAVTLLNPPYSTNGSGAKDTSPVDIGFHHQSAGAGPLVSVTTDAPTTCGVHVIQPSFQNRPAGEPGHLIGVATSSFAPPITAVFLSSLTTLDPPGAATVIARDLGDGRYAFGATADQSGDVTFEIYADEDPTPQSVIFTVPGGC